MSPPMIRSYYEFLDVVAAVKFHSDKTSSQICFDVLAEHLPDLAAKIVGTDLDPTRGRHPDDYGRFFPWLCEQLDEECQLPSRHQHGVEPIPASVASVADVLSDVAAAGAAAVSGFAGFAEATRRAADHEQALREQKTLDEGGTS